MDQDINQLSNRLKGLTPDRFNVEFDYFEKVKLILFLTNSMHDTKSFKEYLTERLGERNTFTKEKQENYASIKEYE